MTDASGCAVIQLSPPTSGATYTASFPNPGYVDIAGTVNPERTIGLIHPGVVATDFAKNVPIPMISPEESAAAVIKVIDGYTSVKQSGDFMSYTGKELPW